MNQDNSKDIVEVKREYYESGALWGESPYVNGKKHGLEKLYYESGVLYKEAPYVTGKKHGIEKHYYKTGALWDETPYVNGMRHGIGRGYDKEKTSISCLTLYDRDLTVTFVKI